VLQPEYIKLDGKYADSFQDPSVQKEIKEIVQLCFEI